MNSSTIKSGVVGLATGLLFGIGLTIAQMTNPKKVLDFLDITGSWDASLALVMGGALLVSGLGYFVKNKMSQPVCADAFTVPNNQVLDKPLIIGSATFGIGWGLAGLCPGPAIASLSYASADLVVFVVAMLLGMLVAKVLKKA
ncbi:DUF6691 family protein [Catenovulum sp. SX2]|uniref:DUF6691 family protein n=1 Tax=Catenovulum sp. SX2 TaxID=3398614 RepID=UPI003F87DFBE